MQVPTTVEESGHIQVHEDGEDLLVGEAVEAADVVTLQQILNGFVPFGFLFGFRIDFLALLNRWHLMW